MTTLGATSSTTTILDAAEIAAAYQPLDSDLTAIAALTTTSYGRALLELANAAAGRTAFGLGTAAVAAAGDFQPNDGDLTAIAALTTTSYGRSLLEAANAGALRTLAGLGTAAVAATGDFEASGAVAAHAAAGDPHTGYAQESALGSMAALNNPMTTAADLIVGGASGALARLAKGSDGQVLTVDPTTHLLVWATSASGGAPTTADYLVGTADGGLSNEIVVGATPGGELGGTWGSPTVDATHSGSSHAGLSGQPGSTDVAVADGGTGAGTAAGARTNLGLVIGTDVAVPVSSGRTNLGGTIGYSYPGVTIGAVLSTFALAINTIEYAFLVLRTAVTIDQCGFVVTTGPASNANVRVGIYAASTDWQPSGNPLFDVGTAVASGFTGVKTPAATVVLPAGRYLSAINCDVAMTVRVWRGFTEAGGFLDSLMASAHTGGTVASTYGAMPAPGTAYTTARSAGDHHVGLRVSVP